MKTEKRKEKRHKPLGYDLVILKNSANQDIMCFILDESKSGCSMVVRNVHIEKLNADETKPYQIKLGNTEFRPAELRWKKEWNTELTALGFRFLA